MSKGDKKELPTANISSESAECLGKGTEKRLLDKCWREEYIRILQWFASNGPMRVDDPLPEWAETDDYFSVIVRELENAGLLIVTRNLATKTAFSFCVSYAGRLEIDRLKSLRPLRKFWQRAQSALFFAAGSLFNFALQHYFGKT